MLSLRNNVALIQRAFWLIRLRWIAVVLLLVGTFFLHNALGIDVKATEIYAVTSLLAIYNSFLLLLLKRFSDKADSTLGAISVKIVKYQIYADTLLFIVLLHYSGGTENPFVFFLIISTIIGNFFLSTRESYIQATFTVSFVGLLLLAEYSELIPHYCLKGSEEYCLRRNGVHILGTFFVFATSIYLAVYVTSYITTCLGRAEQAFRSSRDYLSRILSGMQDGLIIIDCDYTIKDVNAHFLEQCGTTRDKIIGSKCYKISHHADKPCSAPEEICPAIKVFDTGETLQVEHTHLDADGNPHFIQLYAFPILAADGNVEEAVVLSHDITELKRNEQALRKANLSLQEKDRVKDEYVARLTHDIRGHLSTIQTCLNIVLAGTLDKQSAEFVSRAFKRTKILTDFTKTFMMLTEIRLNAKADMNEFSLKASVNQVVDTLRSKAEEKSIKLTCNISETIENMRGVKSYIEEMLKKLLLHAIRYTPDNGSITVNLKREFNSVRIEVNDTGIGIPPAEQDKIFDEFYWTNKGIEVEEHSQGLGLVLVKYIVEVHGGDIIVESREGCGTTFKILLPCIAP